MLQYFYERIEDPNDGLQRPRQRWATNEEVPWLQENFDAMEADLKDDADAQGFRTPKSLRVAICDPDSAATAPLDYEDFQAWLGGGQTRAQFFQDQWC